MLTGQRAVDGQGPSRVKIYKCCINLDMERRNLEVLLRAAIYNPCLKLSYMGDPLVAPASLTRDPISCQD